SASSTHHLLLSPISYLSTLPHSPVLSLSFLFFYSSAPHPHLHSFPTRRSSDLTASGNAGATGARPLSPRLPSCPGWRQSQCKESDRKSTRLNSSHLGISYAVFCLKKKKKKKKKNKSKIKN